MSPDPVPAAPAAPAPINICARRGAVWLEADDLTAHLAALLRLEHVGLLLGSGSSAGPVGGMTISGLWAYFCNAFPNSLQWLKQEKFVSADGTAPNVEALDDTLEIAKQEWKRQGKPRKLKEIERAHADLKRAVMKSAILNQAWWTSPRIVEALPDELRTHRTVLQKVCGARQPGQPSPWVFTTNYDLAVEWAAESVGLKTTNGFSGTHYRTFAPHNFDLDYRNTLARGEARFGTYNVYLAKLHGSLTWRLHEASVVVEESAGSVWPDLNRFLSGGIEAAPGYLVLPSAAKYLQTVGFVFGELFRRCTEFLAKPQSAFITTGYSFSDEHLNRILLTALQNPTLHMVAYLPEASRNGNDLAIPDSHQWAKRLASLNSPQVTIVGGGTAAYFSAFAQHLPEPAVYDERAAEIREMLRRLENPGPAPAGP